MSSPGLSTPAFDRDPTTERQAMRFLPPSVSPAATLILTARGLRAVVDGCISVVLPAYLLALGLGALQIGVLSTATLLGSRY